MCQHYIAILYIASISCAPARSRKNKRDDETREERKEKMKKKKKKKKIDVHYYTVYGIR